jgi:hypothetical protein
MEGSARDREPVPVIGRKRRFLHSAVQGSRSKFSLANPSASGGHASIGCRG